MLPNIGSALQMGRQATACSRRIYYFNANIKPNVGLRGGERGGGPHKLLSNIF